MIDASDDISEYEKLRLKKIEENRRCLLELGLASSLTTPKPQRAEPKDNSTPKSAKKRRQSSATPIPARRIVTRRSVQLGDQYQHEQIENDEEEAAPPPKKKEYRENFFGAVPGTKVGDTWEYRLECSTVGIHRPTVAGIHGGPDGAYSIALSGGYEDDVDYGDHFTYTGAGGRDLKGTKANPKNLRTAPQSKNQTPDGPNASLIASVKTKNPVRVIRGYKLSSLYAPESGYRYDGLYTVDKYWTETGLAGYLVYKFRLSRMKNQDPPIWELETNQENSKQRINCQKTQKTLDFSSPKDKNSQLKIKSPKKSPRVSSPLSNQSNHSLNSFPYSKSPRKVSSGTSPEEKAKSPTKVLSASQNGEVPSKISTSPLKSSSTVSTSPSKVLTPPSKASISPSKVSNSPSKISTSPSKVSATPSKISTSPLKVSTTPAKGSTTPSKVSTSPSKVSTPPPKVSTTPSKVSTSPSKSSISASKVSTPLSQSSASPLKVSISPSKVSTSLSKLSATPIKVPFKVFTSPLRMSTSPFKVSTSSKSSTSPLKVTNTPIQIPFKVLTSPLKMSVSPMKVSTSPSQVSPSPSQVSTSPSQVSTSPSQIFGSSPKVLVLPSHVPSQVLPTSPLKIMSPSKVTTYVSKASTSPLKSGQVFSLSSNGKTSPVKNVVFVTLKSKSPPLSNAQIHRLFSPVTVGETSSKNSVNVNGSSLSSPSCNNDAKSVGSPVSSPRKTLGKPVEQKVNGFKSPTSKNKAGTKSSPLKVTFSANDQSLKKVDSSKVKQESKINSPSNVSSPAKSAGQKDSTPNVQSLNKVDSPKVKLRSNNSSPSYVSSPAKSASQKKSTPSGKTVKPAQSKSSNKASQEKKDVKVASGASPARSKMNGTIKDKVSFKRDLFNGRSKSVPNSPRSAHRSPSKRSSRSSSVASPDVKRAKSNDSGSSSKPSPRNPRRACTIQSPQKPIAQKPDSSSTSLKSPPTSDRKKAKPSNTLERYFVKKFASNDLSRLNRVNFPKFSPMKYNNDSDDESTPAFIGFNEITINNSRNRLKLLVDYFPSVIRKQSIKTKLNQFKKTKKIDELTKCSSSKREFITSIDKIRDLSAKISNMSNFDPNAGFIPECFVKCSKIDSSEASSDEEKTPEKKSEVVSLFKETNEDCASPNYCVPKKGLSPQKLLDLVSSDEDDDEPFFGFDADQVSSRSLIRNGFLIQKYEQNNTKNINI